MNNHSSYLEYIDTLCKRLQQEEAVELRIEIIESLGEMGNEQASKCLNEAIKDENAEIRKAAIKASKNLKINKANFLLYLEEFLGSQKTIKDIFKREDILDYIAGTSFAFQKENNNPNITQHFHDRVDNATGSVGRDSNINTAEFSQKLDQIADELSKNQTINYNYDCSSSDKVSQELNQILDLIIKNNLDAAHKSAQNAIKNLPKLLRNSQAIKLVVSSNPRLKNHFHSAISIVGIEKVTLIFTLADIPIEGFNI